MIALMVREKNASNSKIKIYNESLSRGKNIYTYIRKKEKTNLVIPNEKNQQIRQKKKNPNVIAAKLQVQKSAQ